MHVPFHSLLVTIEYVRKVDDLNFVLNSHEGFSVFANTITRYTEISKGRIKRENGWSKMYILYSTSLN